jgi:hypothetical protein
LEVLPVDTSLRFGVGVGLTVLIRRATERSLGLDVLPAGLLALLLA